MRGVLSHILFESAPAQWNAFCFSFPFLVKLTILQLCLSLFLKSETYRTLKLYDWRTPRSHFSFSSSFLVTSSISQSSENGHLTSHEFVNPALSLLWGEESLGNSQVPEEEAMAQVRPPKTECLAQRALLVRQTSCYSMFLNFKMFPDYTAEQQPKLLNHWHRQQCPGSGDIYQFVSQPANPVSHDGT